MAVPKKSAVSCKFIFNVYLLYVNSWLILSQIVYKPRLKNLRIASDPNRISIHVLYTFPHNRNCKILEVLLYKGQFSRK